MHLRFGGFQAQCARYAAGDRFAQRIAVACQRQFAYRQTQGGRPYASQSMSAVACASSNSIVQADRAPGTVAMTGDEPIAEARQLSVSSAPMASGATWAPR